MHTFFGCFLLAASTFLVVPAESQIASIHAERLPRETAVLAALDDARQMEPYSHSFSATWNYDVPKDEVTRRLEKDLGFLQAAANSHPENAELQLLTGLVAHYAYNLDIDGSYDTALDGFARSQKLTPDDLRPQWFRASFLCQTDQPKPGAEQFLGMEKEHPWQSLPVEFWQDYMECAIVTGMPAHVLRAGDHLTVLHAPPSHEQTFLTEIAQKRFEAFDPSRKYEQKDAWSAQASGEDIEFTSTMCGVRFQAYSNWRVNQLDWRNGTCLAYFSTGPYQAVTEKLNPSVLLMVQQPREGETLQEYAQRFMKDGPLTPYTPTHCPADACLAFKQDAPGMYHANGNGHGRLVVFERDQPQYPGLIFERPWQMPKSPEPGAHYFRPGQVQKRIPGKLYYLVLLDAAASIEEPALKDFGFFLDHLIVE